MSRLWASIGCDVRVQYRNGFYLVTAVVAGLWLLTSGRLPPVNLGWLVPVIILNDMLLITFLFVGGLVLLEKGEGTLQAQLVSPLRFREYLAAKVCTLTVLALAQSLAMVAPLSGLSVAWASFTLGVALAAMIFILAGFIAVARYDSVNEYLMPAIIYGAVLLAPPLLYVVVGPGPLVLLHPLAGPVVLLQAAFGPVRSEQIVVGVFSSVVWLAVLYRISHWAFDRYVVAQRGG